MIRRLQSRLEANEDSGGDEKDHAELPVSFIDVVFLLLIFFLVTFTAGLADFNPVPEKDQETTKYELPEVEAGHNATAADIIEGVQVLIQKDSLGVAMEYFLLGYDNEDVNTARENLNESNLSLTIAWKDSLTLQSSVGEHRQLIESNRFIQPGKNYIRRVGQVYPSSDSDGLERERANFRLFFKRVKQFERFQDRLALDVSVKADQDVSIGFINDLITICGADSIENVRFILQKKSPREG